MAAYRNRTRNQPGLDHLSEELAYALQLQEYENPSLGYGIEVPGAAFLPDNHPRSPAQRRWATRRQRSPPRSRARWPPTPDDPFSGSGAWFDATDQEMAQFGPGVWREMQRQALESFQVQQQPRNTRPQAVRRGGGARGRGTNARNPPPRPDPSSSTNASSNTNAHTISGGECTSCMETITGMGFKTLCNHKYCKACAAGVITASLTGGSFPPSCCAQPFPEGLVKSAVSNADYQRYQDRIQETTAKVLLYCPRPRCAKQIPENHIRGDQAQCPRCNTKVCVNCKHVAHPGGCKEDKAFTELVDLARGKGWQQCPRCQVVVEKTGLTCNEIKCKCGESFCYKCGTSLTQTRGCRCPLFDAEVVDALNQRERRGLFGGGRLEEDLVAAREWGVGLGDGEDGDDGEDEIERAFQHARPYMAGHVRHAPLPLPRRGPFDHPFGRAELPGFDRFDRFDRFDFDDFDDFFDDFW